MPKVEAAPIQISERLLVTRAAEHMINWESASLTTNLDLQLVHENKPSLNFISLQFVS